MVQSHLTCGDRAVEALDREVGHTAGHADLAAVARQSETAREQVAVVLVEDAARTTRCLRFEDVGRMRPAVWVGPLAVQVCDKHLRLVTRQGGTTVIGDALVAVFQRLLELGGERPIIERLISRPEVRRLVCPAQRHRAGDRPAELAQEGKEVVFVDVALCRHLLPVVALGHIAAEEVRHRIRRGRRPGRVANDSLSRISCR